tara:strand:- start:35386 stop:35931 length:546 start_codon:yes stop_codon:yes gene_type:complete
MNILEKRPDLKAILGKTGTENEFKEMLKGMSPEELASLNHYLSKALDDSDVDVWQKTQMVRKVESQIYMLKEDYKKILGKLQLIQTDMRKSFGVIYKLPQKAEEKCSKWESIQGVIKTGWTIRNKPSVFGPLRGMSLLGVATNSRRRAQEKALTLNYEGMKSSFDEGKKIAKWLGHILKGA